MLFSTDIEGAKN